MTPSRLGTFPVNQDFSNSLFQSKHDNGVTIAPLNHDAYDDKSAASDLPKLFLHQVLESDRSI